MRDYYQEMRDACAEIVKGVASAYREHGQPECSGSLHDVLEMAKWVSLEKTEAIDASKEAVSKGIGDAFTKLIQEEM